MDVNFFVCLSDVELSNLLVIRQGVKPQVPPDSFPHQKTQLRFHQIKEKKIVQVKDSLLHCQETLFSSL